MTRFHNRDSKIGKGWANRVGRAKDNDKARAASGDVRMACEGLRVVANAARKVDDSAWGNADRKMGGNEAPAMDRAVACPGIRSSWRSTPTATVSFRPGRLPRWPPH